MRNTVAIALVLAIGCSDPASKPAPSRTAETPSTAEPKPAAAPKPESSVTGITFVDPSGLDAEIAKQSGKIVLVDFWSTTCIPCLHGLPKMAELRRKYANKGLVVISVGMDDRQDDETDDQFQSRILSALGNSGADFKNLGSKPGGGEEAMASFGIDGGALPHYRLFGRDGRLVRKFVSGDPDSIWDHTDVVAAVEAAVAK